MGCDLQKYRRRRRWEKSLSALAPESVAKGFNQAEACSLECWVEWDSIPIIGAWTFLDQCQLITHRTPAPPNTIDYAKLIQGGNAYVTLQGFGGNNVLFNSLGEPYNVFLQLRACLVSGSSQPPDFTEQFSNLYLLGPSVVDEYRFAVWQARFNGVSIPADIGPASVYQLAACHDCSNAA